MKGVRIRYKDGTLSGLMTVSDANKLNEYYKGVIVDNNERY